MFRAGYDAQALHITPYYPPSFFFKFVEHMQIEKLRFGYNCSVVQFFFLETEPFLLLFSHFSNSFTRNIRFPSF